MRWLLFFFLLNVAFVISLAFLAFMGAGSVALENGIVTLGGLTVAELFILGLSVLFSVSIGD